MGSALRLGSLPPDTPQAEIQRRLEAVHRRQGLPAALEQLFEFELAAGYLTREKLEEVERLSWQDPETSLSFRIQVNFARSRYQPAAPAAPAGQQAQRDSPDSARACLLCKSNIGRPGKESLRVYEFPLGGRERRFFVQLTPFPLFPYHFVLILNEHVPQSIDRRTLPDMLAFLDQAPGYTVCSNSDVEWAGSSILDHLHFQVFRGLHLPVLDARGLPPLRAKLGGCTVEGLRYPLSSFRLCSPSADSLRQAGWRLIELWKTQDPGRNTVNLVLVRARSREAGAGTDRPGDAADGGCAGGTGGTGGTAPEYRLTVLLRNPDYRTPPELQRFKSEGVGVIEASGEAILPVPAGQDAEALWESIRTQGLQIAKGIIRGNSPALSQDRMAGLLEELASSFP